VLEFITSSLELKPNKITDDEDKNKSSMEFRLTEPLLIAKRWGFISSASIAANPMLAAVIVSQSLNALPYPNLLFDFLWSLVSNHFFS